MLRISIFIFESYVGAGTLLVTLLKLYGSLGMEGLKDKCFCYYQVIRM